jgi:hypothetical protein
MTLDERFLIRQPECRANVEMVRYYFYPRSVLSPITM